MKRRLTVLVAAVATAMFAVMPAASAETVCDTGEEYAHAHIVVLAQDGNLGQGNNPGMHQGFAGVPATCGSEC